MFAVIAGLPPELVADADYDFDSVEQAVAFYDQILAHPDMQQQLVPGTDEGLGRLRRSCGSENRGWEVGAEPPRRLVEVAKGFGENAVLTSICAAEFGATTGAIIRAIGKRLIDAAANPPDAG